jgi:hypothetical protein
LVPLACCCCLHLLELLLHRDFVIGASSEELQTTKRGLWFSVLEEPAGRLGEERQGEDEDGRGRVADVERDAVCLSTHDAVGLVIDHLRLH